jgi:catechol 2,3-dioxygenase-like lactoylglutathione lyase family enzyme
MALVNDVHHIAFLTADMDRLTSFYARILDARVTLDVEDPVRHAFIEVGPHTVLHPFEVPATEVPGRQPMFKRGRLDHFALNAVSEEAFREIRRRVIAEGAHATEGGLVTDMGAMLSFTFHDPDDAWVEVMWLKPGVRFEDAPTGPAEWKMIDLD